MSGLTYDSGALVAAGRDDRRMWALHKRALQRGAFVTVPAVVLVECWRGQPAVARLLEGCGVEGLEEAAARAAGILLGRCTTPVGAVDAVVVEGALRRGDIVVTSDREDVKVVAAAAGRRVAVLDI